MKNKKLCLAVLGATLGAQGALAFDYDVYGGAYAFSKIGFNNVKENTDTGKYPTDSWASIALDLNIRGSFVDGFTYGLGGMLSAPVWDPYQASYAYINGNARHSLNPVSNREINYRYYVLSTAYLGYEYKSDAVSFGLKAGRYDDHGLDWFSGFSEGTHFYVGNDLVKFQFNWVARRGLAYNEWFYDFYFIGKDDKYDFNRYFLIGSLDVNIGGFNIKPQVWYHRNDYIAPGLNLSYKFDNGIISSTTSIYSLFVLSQKSYSESGNLYRNGTDDRLGAILIVKEDIEHMGWKFGLGIWKNFGNPDGNSGIGRHGHKAGIDEWTASAGTSTFAGFDAWALSDINSYNAFTGWLYAGKSYGAFNWNILARATTSKPSDEQAVALSMGYNFTEQISVGLKLEWFNDISKKFERTGYAQDYPLLAEANKIRNDRSHAFVTFAYNF